MDSWQVKMLLVHTREVIFYGVSCIMNSDTWFLQYFASGVWLLSFFLKVSLCLNSLNCLHIEEDNMILANIWRRFVFHEPYVFLFLLKKLSWHLFCLKFLGLKYSLKHLDSPEYQVIYLSYCMSADSRFRNP